MTTAGAAPWDGGSTETLPGAAHHKPHNAHPHQHQHAHQQGVHAGPAQQVMVCFQLLCWLLGCSHSSPHRPAPAVQRPGLVKSWASCSSLQLQCYAGHPNRIGCLQFWRGRLGGDLRIHYTRHGGRRAGRPSARPCPGAHGCRAATCVGETLSSEHACARCSECLLSVAYHQPWIP